MTRSWEEMGMGGGVPRVKTFHWRRPLGTLMCLFVSSTEGGTADALMESAGKIVTMDTMGGESPLGYMARRWLGISSRVAVFLGCYQWTVLL